MKNPEIIVIHNFAMVNECDNLIEKARGKLATTTLFTNSSQVVTNARTSKMMYLSEQTNSDALTFTKRIQMITRFNLSNEPYASENFKVMNYGIGGKVQGHWDSTGNSTGGFIFVYLGIQTKYLQPSIH